MMATLRTSSRRARESALRAGSGVLIRRASQDGGGEDALAVLDALGAEPEDLEAEADDPAVAQRDLDELAVALDPVHDGAAEARVDEDVPRVDRDLLGFWLRF